MSRFTKTHFTILPWIKICKDLVQKLGQRKVVDRICVSVSKGATLPIFFSIAANKIIRSVFTGIYGITVLLAFGIFPFL